MGWREVIAASQYDWDMGIVGGSQPTWAEYRERDLENAVLYETCGNRHAAALLAMPASDRIALARELLAGTGRVDVDFALLEAAHACMRETGWQLAPAHVAYGSDGILEAACAEVVEQVGETLDVCRAAMLYGSLNVKLTTP